MLCVVEGVDGAGKTHVAQLLKTSMMTHYPQVEIVNCRAPDGPIREVLLNRPEGTVIDNETELLLFVTCHRWLLINKVLPALARGAIVILDRFTDSTISYQGGGRGLGVDHVTKLLDEHVYKPFGEAINADYRIFVEAKEDVREERLMARGNLDHMDKQGLEFRRRNQDVMRFLANCHESSPNHRYGRTEVARFQNNGTFEELQEKVEEWVSSINAAVVQHLTNVGQPTARNRAIQDKLFWLQEH